MYYISDIGTLFRLNARFTFCQFSVLFLYFYIETRTHTRDMKRHLYKNQLISSLWIRISTFKPLNFTQIFHITMQFKYESSYKDWLNVMSISRAVPLYLGYLFQIKFIQNQTFFQLKSYVCVSFSRSSCK